MNPARAEGRTAARHGRMKKWKGVAMRNWKMKDIGQGVVKGGVLTVPADKPIFIIELTR